MMSAINFQVAQQNRKDRYEYRWVDRYHKIFTIIEFRWKRGGLYYIMALIIIFITVAK